MDRIGLLANPCGCAPGPGRPGQRAPPVHRSSRAKGGAMAEIVATVEIARRPGEVFAYAADPVHHPARAGSVVSARRQEMPPSRWGRKSW